MSAFQEIVVVKDCRKYTKKYYKLFKEVDHNLLALLGDFGLVEVNEFSKFHPTAKDSFRIFLDSTLSISGVLKDNVIHITISKSYSNLIEKIEEVIKNWCK
jgi:hypothetical protein